MANSVDPDQTAPIEAVCSGSTLFASILNSSVMLGNYLQLMTSAEDILTHFFLGALRVNVYKPSVLSMGHRKTVQTQIRHSIIMLCLIRIFTVC